MLFCKEYQSRVDDIIDYELLLLQAFGFDLNVPEVDLSINKVDNLLIKTFTTIKILKSGKISCVSRTPPHHTLPAFLNPGYSKFDYVGFKAVEMLSLNRDTAYLIKFIANNQYYLTTFW